jgi:ribosome-associated translation inhibitor RaiA/cold shock CspA family protein
MQVPLQITIRDLPHSDALEARIRDSAAKLEQFHPRISGCRVTIEESAKHHHQGRQFRVRIDLRVPGRAEIVATRHHDEDVYVALRDAFDSAKRQVEEVVREKRGDVKVHEVPRHGKVTRLAVDEGYGFIATEDGRELYFSRENVVHPAFEHLKPGTSVQFVEDLTGEGPQAKRVSVGKHHV